ncbi:hypothetical protein BBP00_00003065 [Phytophthora kernoviae]|uniref:DNA mismatch repair proteins mutS family domain-containing protein n=1 Tax=Phytophthora kernoviae TaxID=325452 RepID=A0A3F2RVM1_9STRA|nr:hypothetical protein BBP00_00003065 [Phytophthora kernoviae]
MGDHDDDEVQEVLEEAQGEVALQIRNEKHLKQIGVAVRRPRTRASCVKGQANEDIKQWELVLYAFSDSSELANLESLLVQLAPSTCYLPADLEQTQSVGDSKKVHALLQTHGVANVYTKKQVFSDVSGLETNVGRLLGTSTMAEYKDVLTAPLAAGSMACLIDALGLMADADTFGCYTLAEGNLSSAMQLDSAAIWSLNLLPEPNSATSGVTRFGGSVLEILNRGKTPMGRRLLERWIRQPLLDVEQIETRQSLVQLFVNDTSLRMELLDECMKALPDLGRLAISLERKKHAKITDLVSVYDAAVGAMPRILKLLKGTDADGDADGDEAVAKLVATKFTAPLEKVVADLEGYTDLVKEVVDLDSRPTLVVNAKHDTELQALREEWDGILADIEEEHRNALNTIGGDIKCEKDKVRGFAFRVVNKKEEAKLSKLPYVHICQVLVSGVQFTTTKLKALATNYRQVRAEYEQRQSHLLNAAIDVASTYVPVLEAATATLAELDVLLGFAHAACHAGSGYCRPTLKKDDNCVVLTGARHPCVELQDGVDFIPNDYNFEREKSRFQLVTGPNMGGKSTYIRQLGTIAVMAQIGSFVPAEVARLPVFDKLLVRVGAGDLQQRGVSTFMLEMLEASAILHKATEQSLVIIDELGRGTSTYDGFGLAWAISEYLLTKARSMCLFATHFHELTSLQQEHPQGFVNKHVTAVASDRAITMVYQVRDGPCMESFGVHVASMAGFPESVLECARRKSQELEGFERAVGSQQCTSGDASPSKRLAEADASQNGEPPIKKARASFLPAFAALPLDKMAPAEALSAPLSPKRHSSASVTMEPPPAKKRRHRFQKVEERVSNLQTELTLHAKTAGAIDEASTLTFKEELSLQAELTTLDSFQNLFRNIQSLVTTTPQLLHHLPKVVKRLQTELKEARDDAADLVVQRQRLVPVLKLVTALARELGKEFYPHFAGVLPLVVAVIDTKDPELSTQVFKTLTMVFNYLRVQLLADMDSVHKCYFPLLGHPREFVRNFAAQTLAVLLRRLESPKAMRKYLRAFLTALVRGSGRNDEILKNGSAKLMFALVKNVNHGFHSRMREVFLFLLGSFRPKTETETVDETELEQQEAVFEIVEQTCGLMMKHTDPDHSGDMLEYLVLVVTKVTTLRREKDGVPTEADDLYLSRALNLLLNFFISRFGKLVSGASNSDDVRVPSVHKVCTSLVSPETKVLISRNRALRNVLMNTFEVVWRLYPAEDTVISSQIKSIFDVVADENDQLYWQQKMLDFVDKVLQSSHVTVHFVETFLLPNALKFGLDTLAKTDIGAFSSLLCKLGNYVAEHEYDISESAYIVPSNSNSRRWLLSFKDINASADAFLLEAGRDVFKKCFENKHDTEALAVSWTFCKSLELVRVDDKKLIGFLTPLVTKCDKQLKSEASTSAFATLRAELWQVQQVSRYKTNSTQLTIAYVEQAILGKEASFTTLSTLLTLIDMEPETYQHEVLATEALPSVANSLFATLRSPAHALRLVTLQLLARFKRLEFMDTGEATLSGPCDLLDVSVELERACENVSVATEREVMRLLTRVKILCRSPQTPELYKKIALSHLHGLYHVKFSIIWPHIADAVETAARQNFNDFWPCISAELLAASIRHEDQNGRRDEGSNVPSEHNGIIKEFERVCMLERGEVPASSATDAATHHTLLWKGMGKFADLVEAKTKFMVPLFLTFLRDQYRNIYTDELNANRLDEIDQALLKLEETSGNADAASPTWRTPVEYQGLTTKTVRGKFVDQLKLFSTFRNMKGAYAQQLLHELFFDLLMKSDEVVSKLALQCLYAFGSKALVSYKTQLNRLVDSSSFREELTSFKVGDGEGVVLREHRGELLPILLRLLYSKCVSKKGRNNGDTVAARRAAILSYLASLETPELASFVELVVRAFGVTIETPEVVAEGASSTVGVVESVPAVAHVQPSRILGFLNLLEDLINQLGVKLAAFVPQIADVLLAILQTSITSKEDDDSAMVGDGDKEEDGNSLETAGSKRKATDASSTLDILSTSTSMKKQIRMLTYRRLAELIDTFDTLVSLQPWVVALLETSHEAIMHLPNAVVGADKASALLEMLVATGRADRARQWLPEPLVLSVITCLSAGLTSTSSSPSRGITPEILDAVLQFMDSLLDGDEYLLGENDEDESMATAKEGSRTLLVRHIPFVLEQFVLRFQAKAARYASDRYAGSSKKELAFLCRLSHHLNNSKGDVAIAAHDLFQLLLPFLLRNHQTTPKDKDNLLEVLANLVPKLSEPKKHVLAFARLLAPGPNCIADREPRQKLVAVFTALGAHPALKDIAPVAELLEELNAYDSKRIEETDYERRLIALNRINTTRFAGFTDETHLLAPLVAQCLQKLSAEIGKEKMQKQNDDVTSPVLNALESLVMPCIRASLRSTNENARPDLVLARNKEDPEADIFYNITHIQAHRRRRALQRLGALMDDMATKANAQGEKQAEVDGEPLWFSNSTVNGIILPLVLHFVYETHAKSQESLRSEAAACVGSAAGLLGWSHYLALLRRLLKSIDGHVEMESAIILSICSAIDHFHFEAPGVATQWQSSESRKEQKDRKHEPTTEDKTNGVPSKVQDNMETQVLPMLYSYLFKGVDSKKSSKPKDDDGESSSLSGETVSVRVPLALAIVKVLRRLRADTFHRELPKLLLRFANILKSKDEAVRVSARSTLVKIAVELGARFLLPIVEELRHTLRDGYMVHVLSFTVHALLEKLPDMLQADGECGLPRKPQSLLLLPKDKQQEAQQEGAFASPLDACVPILMEMLTAELFQGMTTIGEAAEAAAGGVERKSAHKSKMKEARSSSGRSLDSLELLARSLPFLPNPSIHAVVSALVQRFQVTDAGAQATAALQEAFKRVALGLAKNPAVEPSYVFLYAYNVLSSSLESFRPTSEREKEQYAAGGSNTELVTSWLVSEKSAAATKLLAARVSARDAARVTMQQQVTGFDKLRQQQQMRTKKQRREEAAALAAESTAHLKELLNFGVFLVFSFLRRSGSVKDQDGDEKKSSSVSLAPAQLIDPLVPLLMRCTGEARSDRATINSLKCLGSLLPRQQQLPALRVARTPLVDRLFKILQKAGAATRNEMVQTCYRTLTSLLKQQQGLELAQQGTPQDSKSEALRLTESQLRVLLSFLRADLDEQDHQNATFALLKAIVNSRLVISEVYDVMMRVGELLVQSDGPGARANCASIYLTFVLEYPLGNKRLLRHLKFLVDNLSYDHATGRSAVLEALRALLSKLPQDLVNTRSQFFFLPLVLRLANDEAVECRDLSKTVLTTLVRRLGNKELNESVLLLGNWWAQATKSDAADAVKLLGTAAQVTTLVLETRPEFFERTVPQVLQAARTALERSLRELQTVEESNQVQWQPVYHVCTALTAFSDHLTGPFEVWLEDSKSKNAFLDVVVLPLLQYPHAWVRLAATKLLTSYLRRRRANTLVFAAPVKRLAADAAKQLRNGALYLQRPGRMFAWASAICKLLEAPSLNDELASEILTAMPFLCEAMEALPDIPQDVTAITVDAITSIDKVKTDVGAEATEEEEAATSEDKEETNEDEAELQHREEEEKEEERAKARTPIGWLLTRLSYVARGSKCSNEVQAVVFKLFAALLHNHDTAFAQQYVVQFINPLYRASSKLEELQAQQEQMKLQQQQRSRQGYKNRRSGPAPEPVALPESALLAQEVLQLLESKLGATPFLEAYSFVQRKMAAAKAARKLQRRTEAVSDPQRAAQRRMQKNEQKRHTKQMRKRKHAVLKGSTSAAVRPTKVLRPGAE